MIGTQYVRTTMISFGKKLVKYIVLDNSTIINTYETLM